PRVPRMAPRFLEAGKVAGTDLIERPEALRVVGPAVQQPVRRIRIAQHLVGDREPSDLVDTTRLRRVRRLRRGRSCRDRNQSAKQYLTASDSSHYSPSPWIRVAGKRRPRARRAPPARAAGL